MLDGIPIIDFTPPVLVGVAVLMILSGRLIPRRFLTESKNESERWREAYENERNARHESDKQTAELMEVARTTNHMVQSMFSAADHIRKSGGANVVVPKD